MGKNKHKAKSEEKTITKNSLGSPFEIDWPQLEKGHNKLILEELKRELPRKLRPRERPPKQPQTHAVGSYELKKPTDEEGNQLIPSSVKNLTSSELPLYKEHLLVGINAITRMLEKEPLSLVLVCKSANPQMMTKHLLLLSATRDTPACCLAGLSETVAPLLGNTSVLALGFKPTSNDYLEDLTAYITDKIPALNIPWLRIWKEATSKQKTVDQSKKTVDPKEQNRKTVVKEDSKNSNKASQQDDRAKIKADGIASSKSSQDIMIIQAEKADQTFQSNTSALCNDTGKSTDKKDICHPEISAIAKKKETKKRKHEEDVIYEFRTPNLIAKEVTLNAKKKQSKEKSEKGKSTKVE